jgi:hypothetical protein
MSLIDETWPETMSREDRLIQALEVAQYALSRCLDHMSYCQHNGKIPVYVNDGVDAVRRVLSPRYEGWYSNDDQIPPDSVYHRIAAWGQTPRVQLARANSAEYTNAGEPRPRRTPVTRDGTTGRHQDE